MIIDQELFLKAIIRESRCSEEEAAQMLNYANNLNSKLHPSLNAWIKNGEVLDFSVDGISIGYIMNKLQTSFLPALFHLNRFLENPSEVERFKNLRVRYSRGQPFGQAALDRDTGLDIFFVS